MGHFELEHAAMALFLDETIRGDGEDDAIAVPARSYTQEEVEAMIWKCRLQKASHMVPLDLLTGMPEWCIDQLVQEFRNRAPKAETTNSRVRAILQRYASDAVREKAVRHFLDFFADRGDGLTGRHLEALKLGDIPRGWWPEYWRSIPSLRRSCQQNQTKKTLCIKYTKRRSGDAYHALDF